MAFKTDGFDEDTKTVPSIVVLNPSRDVFLKINMMALLNPDKEWDFVGGQGAYVDLLDCFEQAASR